MENNTIEDIIEERTDIAIRKFFRRKEEEKEKKFIDFADDGTGKVKKMYYYPKENRYGLE
jgi:hypothetical protein